MANTVDVTVNGLKIPWAIISSELEGLYGSSLLAEFKKIITYYEVYEKGASFAVGTHTDFTPADLRFKESRKLINKEARFLFSKHPDFWVNVPYASEDAEEKEVAQEQTTTLQTFVDNVFDKTHFFSKLVKAAKDCFIGKRVAYFVNFDEEQGRITIDFLPSLEFVFETDPNDTDRLTKIITFYTVEDHDQKSEQRIYRKKYWLEGPEEVCWLEEAIFNGLGDMIEEVTPARATKFKGVIPAGVIINEGLTGDVSGTSEIEELEGAESWFSRLSSGDIDSERCGMNPIRWSIDMNPETTKGLSIAPGAFWDLASDPNAANENKGSVGMMETSLSYSNSLNSTLSRIRSSMYEALDVPDLSPDALKGVVSSGKTLKAIYWGLIVRCDEKMLAWRPALRNIVSLIIEGGKLYPKSAAQYTEEPLPDVTYEITVENQYPIPDDEADEKQIDLAEVNAQTMSKAAYMKKWRNLTDAEAQEELKQIAMERELLEGSYGNLPETDYGMGTEPPYEGEEGEEEDTLGLEDEEEEIVEEEDDFEASNSDDLRIDKLFSELGEMLNG